MKNHAILIQAHTQPELLGSIIKRLSSSNHHFFIHVDKKVNDYDQFLKYSSYNVHFINKRYKVNWGAYEQLLLTLELINAVKNSRIEFDYYHLISGQDFPILDANSFDVFFETKNESFMELDTVTRFENRYMLIHLNSQINIRDNRYNKLYDKFIKLQELLLHKGIRFRHSIPFQPYKGSNWWSLTSEAIDYVLEFLRNNKWYSKRFKFTSCCDEVFFHTILFNSPLTDKIVTDDLRYVEWSRKYNTDTLPRLLDLESFDDILHSGKVFMRKVDIKISGPLVDKVKRICKDDKLVK